MEILKADDELDKYVVVGGCGPMELLGKWDEVLPSARPESKEGCLWYTSLR